MSEYIVDTFGIVQDFADLHGDMNTPLYQAIMNVMLSRQHEEIVRCRDCKYYKPKEGAMLSCKFEYHGFTQWKLAEPDGFCAWAERKEGGDGLDAS